MLGPTLTSSVPGLVLQECRAEVVRYGPGSCVLRYELAWRLQPSRRSLKQVVYGKVYGDDRGRLVGPAVIALRQHEPDGPGPPCRSGAPVPGVSARPAAGAARGGARVAAAVGTAPGPGRMRRPAVPRLRVRSPRVPGSPPPCTGRRSRSGAARGLAGDIDLVRASVDRLAPLAPALAESLHSHLAAVGELAADATRAARRRPRRLPSLAGPLRRPDHQPGGLRHGVPCGAGARPGPVHRAPRRGGAHGPRRTGGGPRRRRGPGVGVPA